MSLSIALTLLLTDEPVVPSQRTELAKAYPAANAPLFPGGPDVECAMAVAAAGDYSSFAVDPVLRAYDDAEGVAETDCSAAFTAAHIATRPYHGPSDQIDGPHRFVTRPVVAPDGKAYIEVHFETRHTTSGQGYEAELKDGTWVLTTVLGWAT